VARLSRRPRFRSCCTNCRIGPETNTGPPRFRYCYSSLSSYTLSNAAYITGSLCEPGIARAAAQTAADVAKAHAADLKAHAKYGVRYLKYCHDGRDPDARFALIAVEDC